MGRGSGAPALRLGLRQIDGLPEEEAQRIVAARSVTTPTPALPLPGGGRENGEGGFFSSPLEGEDDAAAHRAQARVAGASGGGCHDDHNCNPFRHTHDLWMRARVRLATLEKLAAADAFRSLGLDRRQALWEVKALGAAEPLPLFSWSETREGGLEPEVTLPAMPLSEHVVNDYQTLRLSLKAHPMSFLRAHLNQPHAASDRHPPLGVIPVMAEPCFAWTAGTQITPPEADAVGSASNVPERSGGLDPGLRRDDGRTKLRGSARRHRIYSCEELRAAKDGAWVSVAGVVLVRQRPGSAKGVVFMTIEDETGIANAVVWPKTLERFRKVVMGARLIVIHGRIQRHEDIIHVVSQRLEDRSDWLSLLSEQATGMKTPLANADHVKSPDIRAEQTGLHNGHPRWAHPRDARIIPKSRDFH